MANTSAINNRQCMRVSVSIVFGSANLYTRGNSLYWQAGSGLRCVGAVVGSSQVQGRSHLTARADLESQPLLCQCSSWLSSLVANQVSLISFFRRDPRTLFLTVCNFLLKIEALVQLVTVAIYSQMGQSVWDLLYLETRGPWAVASRTQPGCNKVVRRSYRVV